MKRNRIFFTVLVLLGTFVSVMNLSAQETNGDKKLYAKSFLNRKAPRLEVGKWLTDVPDMEGKFVLIEFWGPSCAPCRASIPTLNEFSKKFKDKLVVIGISPNKEESVRKMKEPVIEYYSAIDTTKEKFIKYFEVKGYPHAVLLNKHGFVCWEGNPVQEGYELTAEVIENLIKKYSRDNGGVERKWAKPFLGEKAPELDVNQWYPEQPDTKGKFVLRDFFAFHCGPCRKAIPRLNRWHKEFADDMVIIGCSRDDISRLRTIEPKIEYCLANIGQKAWTEMELHVYSYVQLLDPKGIVRWEGVCVDLTEEKIKEIIAKYK
ncbi:MULTISPECIES: TlpA family protein disulfide reductase [Butyricimonas]|uniref:TlpA family protein disulfide reductase n=1 Tax=Butyricimonas TaxID=574697 RepID=UPI0009F23705|nr:MULTISPECIES: redoxin domain-containing protein [Butyricimonas]